MRSRVAAAAVVLLTFTAPAMARVISYAPYSNQASEPGINLRTSRWFVLLEGNEPAARKAVLYDATGEEEPRVVWPPQGTATIKTAAVYEPRNGGAPMLLVDDAFSADGGRTWKHTGAEAQWERDDWDYDLKPQIDFGGPGSRGMNAPIQLGDDAVPFVLTSYNGIFAVTADGTLRSLADGGRAIGRNRAGARFLALIDGRLVAVDADGDQRVLAHEVPSADWFTGWIAPDGTAYLQLHRGGRGYLFHVRRQQMYFVAGPYDATLYPSWDERDTELRSFAVPTHDFSGAWIVQRAPGEPTKLLRYNGRELREQWSDPAGPQVEALIPGDSGRTLLVQVHVPRDVNVETPFVDPALAVWHEGEGYPTSYDELYLNEETNKGFVHVDPDRIAAGEPFVFSSGFVLIEPEPSGPVSGPIGGGGDVIQEWGVVRGSLKQRLVLPGVARMRGAFGSQWTTDVAIYNPLDEPQEVDVTFVGSGGTAAASLRRPQTVRLASREIKVIPDVLNGLFLVAGTGGTLYFDPEVGVNVFARTYHRDANGTAGYGMLAYDVFNSAGPRFPVTFSGAFPGPAFRTNVLVTDTSGRGTAAKLHVHGPAGKLATIEAAEATAPRGFLQRNRLDAGTGSALIVEPTRGTAIASVVAIDNRTNDATLFPPDLPATIARSIPMIASVENLRSDLYLLNPHDESRTVTLEAKIWDKSVRRIVNVTLQPREARVIPNALQTLYGQFGIARLRYAGGVYVTSRTYRTDANGGTYGTLVPALNNFQIAAPGDRLEILGITGGGAFRTNLALIELSQANTFRQVSFRVRIYDERHRELDAFTTTLDSTYAMQISDLFAARGLDTPAAAMLELEVLGDGLVAAFATLEDKGTGDLTYLPANLGAK